MPKKLFIFPSSGNGLEACDCLTEEYELAGFIDDNHEKQKDLIYGYPICPREVLGEYPETYLLAVIGGPASYLSRSEIIQSFQIPENRFATVIHPNATISKHAKVGYNSLIMAGVVITSNANLGNHVVVLPNSVIHHDTNVEDYSIIGSNVVIAGHSRIGMNCYIGSGTNIINNVQIGENTLIGLGSNVIKNIGANQKVVGNPAKEIKISQAN